MSFLDLYTGDQQQAMRPAPNEGHDLPATFGESFHAAWDYGRLFEQSVSHENARQDALGDYIDDVRQQTGKDPAAGVDWTLSAPGVGDVPVPTGMLLDNVNAAVTKINSGRPPDQQVQTLAPEDLDQRAIAKSRAAGRALADVERREHSGLGTFLGSTASAVTDPINILALPIAPETAGAGIVGAALRWGGVAALAQTGIEAAGAGYREQVAPGYMSSGAPAANVATAFAGGAFLGGATRALGNAWTRLKTGAWPTSIKDAGNVLESEAHVADTNVYEGAAGEAAHRDALTTGIDQVLKGEPVDVSHIVTPDIEADFAERFAPMMAERDRASSLGDGPQAQDHIDALSDQISRAARAGGYAMPKEEADRFATSLARMAPGDAQDALRGFQVSPRQTEAIVDHPAAFPESRAAPESNQQGLKTTLDSAEHERALEADVNREQVGDVSRTIPVGLDEHGNVIERSLDDLQGDVEAYRKVADQIAACAAPTPEESANGLGS